MKVSTHVSRITLQKSVETKKKGIIAYFLFLNKMLNKRQTIANPTPEKAKISMTTIRGSPTVVVTFLGMPSRGIPSVTNKREEKMYNISVISESATHVINHSAAVLYKI